MALSKWTNQAVANTKAITHKYGATFGTISDGTPDPLPSNITSSGPGIASSLSDAITKGGIGNFARGIVASTGAYNRESKQQAASSAQQTQLLAAINKLWKQGKISDAAYKKMTAGIATNINESSAKVGENTEAIMGATNARKVAFGAAETALTPFMFSPTGIAGATKLSGTLVSAKMLPKLNLAKTVGQQSILGAMQGAAATGTADDFNARDLARNMAIGGTIGAVASGGPSLIAKGTDKIAKSVGKSLWGSIEHTAVGGALKEVGIKTNQALMSKMARLKSTFKGLKDIKGRDIGEELTIHNSKIQAANGIADKWLLQDSGFLKVKALTANKTQDEVKAISQAAADYRARIIKNKGAGKLARYSGPAEGKAMFQALNESKDNLIKLAYERGAITADEAKLWIGDKDYIRVQRKLDKVLKQHSGGSSLGSTSKNVFDQKLRGSNAAVVDALSAHDDWVHQAFTDMARTDMSRYIAEEGARHGIANKLVDADKVLMRKEMGKLLSATSAGKKFEVKMVKRYSKQVLAIQKELTAIKATGRKTLAKELNKSIKTAAGPGKEGVMDTKSALADILATDSKDLRKLKKMMANREPKMAAALDNLIHHKDNLEAFSTVRGDAWKVKMANADAETRGKAVITTINKGIKEIYEVDPQLADSIKNISHVTYGPIMAIAMAPGRFLRLSATGLNPVFTFIKNPAKDQLESAIVSGSARKTHAITSIMAGVESSLRDFAGKAPKDYEGVNAKLIQDLLDINSGQSYFSLTRNENKLWDGIVDKLDLAKTFKQKLSSGYRKTEDAFGTTEVSTRVQNGIGAYKSAIGKGMTHEQAVSKMLYASRVNTGDFMDYGEWAKGMRLANVYLPAGLASTRTFAKALAERPTATTAKVGMLLITPSIISTYNNLSDPERAAFYASLPSYDRENNFIWVFKFKGNMTSLTIPLPPTVKPLAKPFRNMVEAQWMDNRQSFMESAKNMIVDPFNPLGSNVSEMLSSVTPPVIKQGIELKLNKQLYSRQEIIPYSMQDFLPEDQVYKTTGTTYKDLGRLTGQSPVKLKYLLNSLGPGLAASAPGNIDAIRTVFLRQSNINIDNKNLYGQAKDAITSPRGNNISEEFYNAYGKALRQQNSASKKVTAAVKAGDNAKAVQIANDSNSKVVEAMNRFDKTYRQYATSEERDKFDKLKKETLISTKPSALKARAK